MRVILNASIKYICSLKPYLGFPSVPVRQNLDTLYLPKLRELLLQLAALYALPGQDKDTCARFCVP